MKHLKRFNRVNGDYQKLSPYEFSAAIDIEPNDFRDMYVDRLSVVFPTALIKREFDTEDFNYYLVFELDGFKAYIYQVKNEYYYVSIYDYREETPNKNFLGASESFFKCDQDTGLIKCLIDNISNLL